jgi:hypothetical protein
MVRSKVSVNNFFSGAFEFLRKLEIPGTATIVCPLLGWVKLTVAVVLAAWGASLGSGVPVGRERSSMGGPPGLQALFCRIAKFSVPSLEQVNLIPRAPERDAGAPLG